MRHRHPVFAIGLTLVASFGSAGLAAGTPGLFDSLPQDAFDQAPSRGAYETAMTRYEVALDARSSGDHVAVFFIPVKEDQVWTWHSDAAAVRRLEKGLFRISVGSCLTGFCTEIECRDAGWPAFQCSDGRMRDMAAPDYTTMTFGNETFTREFPLSEAGEDAGSAPAEAAGETVAPETKKPAAGGGAAGFNR